MYYRLRQGRNLVQRLARTIVASAVLVLVLYGGVMIIIANQSTQAELRPVDALLVLNVAEWDGTPSTVVTARLDEAIRLYRLGYATRIVLAASPGTAPSSFAQQYLVQNRIADIAIGTVAPAVDLRDLMAVVAAFNQDNSIQTMLLVGDPALMLRALKVSHDLRLVVYAAPVQANAPPGRVEALRANLAEANAYLQYILLNQ